MCVCVCFVSVKEATGSVEEILASFLPPGVEISQNLVAASLWRESQVARSHTLSLPHILLNTTRRREGEFVSKMTVSN